MSEQRLKDKVALITGGASGIGKATALLFAEEGAKLVLTDVNDTRGEELANQIKASGGEAIFRHHDVSSEAEWISVIAATQKHFGRLDILMNNAGVFITGPVTEFSIEDFRRQNAVNIEGVFLGFKHGLPLMREGKHGGSVITTSSAAARMASGNAFAYSATKAAVAHLSKCVAKDCGERKDGIRVNSLHPGIIETPLWAGHQLRGPSRTSPNEPLPDLGAITAKLAPLGRVGTADDIAKGALFLASDASRYVTGVEFYVDGGVTI